MLVANLVNFSVFLVVAWLCTYVSGTRQLKQKVEGYLVDGEWNPVTGSSDSVFGQVSVSATSQGVCATLENSDLPEFPLSQSDFDQGSQILLYPGVYKLTNDIVFNPNSATALGVDYYSAGDVQPSQFAIYNPKAFGIGFFAAVVIAGKDIVLDLNGFKISQSKEHGLHQRFYFHVELASSPFIQGQGPHDFGKEISSSNVCVKNGALGLSSHGGIHGNGNTNIEIRDLTIDNFEVAAVHLNKGTNVTIANIEIPSTRTDVPVIGRFSAARFMRPWVNQLVDGGYSGTLNIGGEELTALEVQTNLRQAINDATEQALTTGKITGELASLFGNPTGLPDGSAMYGIILNSKGVAVNGVPSNVPVSERSQQVTIQNVNIGTMTLKTREIPVLTVDGVKPATDAVGAALNTQDGFTLSAAGAYIGNAVANAQLIVAKAIHGEFDFGNLKTDQNKIAPEVVAWAESGESYQSQNLDYLCNGDTMFHVNKGAIAFKLDASIDVVCENCVVDTVDNQGDIGSTICNNNIAYMQGTGVSNPMATQPGYNGGASRGFSLSSTTNANLTDCSALNVLARAGDAIGFDITHGSSVITLQNIQTGTIAGGTGYSEEDYDNNPTPLPKSVAINYDSSVRGITETK
eukprot:TRINITY_DN2143_c0_g1_i1.p1 TRINITY_DN2143_c0_g1~~TRINITY_DN2143_c0_g1_i1.p1  ORF type:complete len:633 (+),score=69.47 TRINITY_DN2143_c0_g1_i1:2195-4093(+)